MPAIYVNQVPRPTRIFFAAGEISGDMQAAHLARAMRRLNPNVYLYGCGGDRLRAAGVDVRIDCAHLGYIAFHRPRRFRRAIAETERELKRLLGDERPDLVVLVDGEGFNSFLIKFMREEGIRFVQYFAPLVLFWGAWRARSVAKHAAMVIPAFPAEVDVFRRAGAHSEWFGHPLREVIARETSSAHPETLRSQSVALMPGSRLHEIERLLPTLLDAAKELHRRDESRRFVLPLAAPHLRAVVQRQLADRGVEHLVRILERDAYQELARCEVALVASGTATLELALLGVPMVVVYRVHPLTYLAARALLKTKFIALPNILLGRAVAAELVQENFTRERVIAAAEALLSNPSHRAAVRNDLAKIGPMLGGTNVLAPAARRVLELAGAQTCFAAGSRLAVAS